MIALVYSIEIWISCLIEKLDVKVYGPPRPIQTGNEVFLACDYLSMANSSPRITWKKIKGGSSEFIYNQVSAKYIA